MAHYIYLFSPDTFAAFSKTDRSIAGVRSNQSGLASKLEFGDKLICYVTKISRWVGVLEVNGKMFVSTKPIFTDEDDPFTNRFNVSPLVWLTLETAIPIHEDRCWNLLTFTKDLPKASARWTPMVRTSLKKLQTGDGIGLESILKQQSGNSITYPLSELDKIKLKTK